MAKAKKEIVPSYIPPPDLYIYFYVGEKYYRRMQPTPYAYKKLDWNYFKKIIK